MNDPIVPNTSEIIVSQQATIARLIEFRDAQGIQIENLRKAGSVLSLEIDELKKKLARAEAACADMQREIELTPMAVSAAIHVQPRETLTSGGTWPENESTETDYVPRAELEKVVKERDELRAAALSLYRQTCIHHTDAERKAAGCPVCQQRERDELREQKKALAECLNWAITELNHFVSPHERLPAFAAAFEKAKQALARTKEL